MTGDRHNGHYDAEAGDDFLHRRIEQLEEPFSALRVDIVGILETIRAERARFNTLAQRVFEERREDRTRLKKMEFLLEAIAKATGVELP